LQLSEKRFAYRRSGRSDIEYYWEFECDCGKKTIARRDRVTAKNNSIISCGCQRNVNKFKGVGELSQSQWYHIEKNAKIRGIDFNLKTEAVWELFLKQDRKCALTGWEYFFR
jgi:hypothetical protein